ncbi:DUF2934 domain-containing protein [Dongia soli]|uniref:DUF2934 domain-containing protein n=1 Tax=Dongia soli TaxID=600628 RepID=A0ABU5EEN8_9PROT|nr:DUF2934 domain-containing protein [Dongia soli]MDY0884681.1 DUF2934 domain-containing protein [Dongia soli]
MSIGGKPGDAGSNPPASYEDLFDEDEADLDRPDLIRRRAYELWLQAGRSGQPDDYLATAEQQMTAEENSDFVPNLYPLNRDTDES